MSAGDDWGDWMRQHRREMARLNLSWVAVARARLVQAERDGTDPPHRPHSVDARSARATELTAVDTADWTGRHWRDARIVAQRRADTARATAQSA